MRDDTLYDKCFLEPKKKVRKIKHTKDGSPHCARTECWMSQKSHAVYQSHVTQHGERANNFGELSCIVRLEQNYHHQNVRSFDHSLASWLTPR